MKTTKYRSGLKDINRYQKKILLLSFVPSTLLCVCMTVLLNLFFKDFGNALLSQETVVDIAYVKYWGLMIMGSLWCFFMVMILWVIVQSNHLVGAFDRVKKELADVAEDRRKEKIVVREKDHLFKELLENINVIIKKLYEKS